MKNYFCNIQPFLKIFFRKKINKIAKIRSAPFFNFLKIKYLEFSLAFVLLVLQMLFVHRKIYFFTFSIS